MRTREDPDRNSFMMTSRSPCCMSPSKPPQKGRRQLSEGVKANPETRNAGNEEGHVRMAETVNSRWVSFSVSQSTFLRVLQKMTA